ncbi:hypothetical protein BDV95DRAFT_570155 [Massariosphaeria phaeospora]|uniref:Uncharacterized protein n=1 Tax=Massariosphaeria phaeospora TaxID=100035 RepID=A0A7C8IAY8_9PLEO|nr:hypothetical protein BDV95DRAFT_570155 [Massariosphaeria phaeospora]
MGLFSLGLPIVGATVSPVLHYFWQTRTFFIDLIALGDRLKKSLFFFCFLCLFQVRLRSCMGDGCVGDSCARVGRQLYELLNVQSQASCSLDQNCNSNNLILAFVGCVKIFSRCLAGPLHRRGGIVEACGTDEEQRALTNLDPLLTSTAA